MNIFINENLLSDYKIMGQPVVRTSSLSDYEHVIMMGDTLYHQVNPTKNKLLSFINNHKEDYYTKGTAEFIDKLEDLELNCRIEGFDLDTIIYKDNIPSIKKYANLLTSKFYTKLDNLESGTVMIGNNPITISKLTEFPSLRPILYNGDVLYEGLNAIFFRYNDIFYIDEDSLDLKQIDNLIGLYYTSKEEYHKQFKVIKENELQQTWNLDKENLLSTNRDELSQKQDVFEDLLQKYMEAYDEVKRLQNELMRLEQGDSNYYKDIKERIEAKFSSVNEILHISKSYFVYKTNTMYMNQGIDEEVELGKYIVYVDLTRGTPKFINTTRIVRGYNERVTDHPHVTSEGGNFCMSSSATEWFPIACRDQDYEKIILMCNNMLRSVAPEDAAGTYWKHWKQDEYIKEL